MYLIESIKVHLLRYNNIFLIFLQFSMKQQIIFVFSIFLSTLSTVSAIDVPI